MSVDQPVKLRIPVRKCRAATRVYSTNRRSRCTCSRSTPSRASSPPCYLDPQEFSHLEPMAAAAQADLGRAGVTDQIGRCRPPRGTGTKSTWTSSLPIADANVLVSAALARSPQAPSVRILDLALSGELDLITCALLHSDRRSSLSSPRPRLRKYFEADEPRRARDRSQSRGDRLRRPRTSRDPTTTP